MSEDTVSISSSTDAMSVSSSCCGNQRELVAALQTALQDFDGMKVNSLIQQGLDIHHIHIDSPKYYTAIHELVNSFVSYPVSSRPAKLLTKFSDVLGVLTANKVDVNDRDRRYQNQTALHLAATSAQHQDTIRILLGCGARVGEPDDGGQTALHKAALSGSVVNVMALLDAGADPNVMDKFGHSPLHMAVRRRKSSELIKALISKGANVNLNHPDWNRQSLGATPLHLAARLGRLENANTLLNNGAEPNIGDSTGQTALHIAAAHELTGKLCEELLRRGAKINNCDTIYGETPLHKAVKTNVVDNVKTLITNSADANIQDFNGNTVLHRAAREVHHFDILHMLLIGGAKLSVTNKDNRTPTDVANGVKNNVARALFIAHLPES